MANELIYRLSDLISSFEKKDLKNSALYLKELIETDDRSRANVILTDNLLDKYRLEIMNNRILVSLTGDEKHEYYYNPKLLCHRLYGHTELWRILLDINEMHSVTQFCQEKLYVMSPGIIEKIFLEIVNLEEYTINLNQSELNSNKNDYIQYLALQSQS